jgi:hypothetical protein
VWTDVVDDVPRSMPLLAQSTLPKEYSREPSLVHFEMKPANPPANIWYTVVRIVRLEGSVSGMILQLPEEADVAGGA